MPGPGSSPPFWGSSPWARCSCCAGSRASRPGPAAGPALRAGWFFYTRRESDGYQLSDDFQARKGSIINKPGKTVSRVLEDGGPRNNSDYRVDSIWARLGYEPNPGGEYFLDFADDKAILNHPYRQVRWVLTREAFHRRNNRLLRELDDGQGTVRQAELAILEPLLAAGCRITLTDFFRDDAQPGAPVGAAITVAKNPLTPLFFGAYGVWIILYGALAWATWQRQGGEPPSPEPLSGRAG